MSFNENGCRKEAFNQNICFVGTDKSITIYIEKEIQNMS